MKKFIKFLIIIGAYAAAAFAFCTVTPVGKDIWSDIITKIETLKTVDNTDNTDNTDNSEEPETNSWNQTKEDSIIALKTNYKRYQNAISKNDIERANDAAIDYALTVEDSKKTWKDFASLMEAKGLPESLPIIETN
jgi:hypothetical protein